MNFAVAAATSSDPYTGLLNYGVLGFLAVILIAFARAAYKRETARADAAEAREQIANASIIRDVLPALNAARLSIDVSNQALADVRAELRREPPPRPPRPRPRRS